MRYQVNAIAQSIDSAFKTKLENDYSVILTWAIFKAGYAVIDVWRGRVAFPELKRVAIATYERWLPVAVLIEDAASGISLIQELKRDTRIPIIAIKVDRDKVARANSVAPLVEGGRVFFLRNMPWLPVLEYELEVFPSGRFDDQVDAFTQFLGWARTHVISGPAQPTGVPKKSTWKE